MRKALFAIIMAVVFFLASCSPPYDGDQFRYVENYSLEILLAVDAALADFDL